MNNKNIETNLKHLFFDLREFSIEEIYASWVRNVLIIIASTMVVFRIYGTYEYSINLYNKIAIVLVTISGLMMLISSTIDYKDRMKKLYQENLNEVKPNIYDISMVCVVIWVILALFVTFVTFKK
jgi:hypothetical protein